MQRATSLVVAERNGRVRRREDAPESAGREGEQSRDLREVRQGRRGGKRSSWARVCERNVPRNGDWQGSVCTLS